ncbi:MAG: lipoprotein [Pseudomonadales bacterium]
MKNTEQKTLAKKTPLLLFLSLSVLTVCISACGQKGALFLPQEEIRSNAVVIDDSTTTSTTALKNIDE